MTVKLWANWDDERILTDSQMRGEVESIYFPEIDNEDAFYEWLAAEYTNAELWNMEETDKDNIEGEFQDYAMDKAWETAKEDGWTQVEVEI